MKERHNKIEITIATINNEIEALEEMLELISDIRMKANIRAKIYELEKERYLYTQLLNFSRGDRK